MLIFLWLTLTTQPQNNQRTMPEPTFQGMLDSAPMVVIARVDSMWYSMEKRPWFTQDGQDTLVDDVFTNVLAEITAVYAKSDTLEIPKGNIHIAYVGGIRPDGIGVVESTSPDFGTGEVFIAGIRPHPWLNSGATRAYKVITQQWKFTVAKDSVVDDGKTVMSLGEALTSLSAYFKRIY